MALPDNVTYGTVTGRFLVDGPGDLDVPGSGKVRFVPRPSRLQNLVSDPPSTILLEPAVYELDDDGYLIDTDGTRSISLVATDNEDMAPVNWTWRVSISVAGQAVANLDMSLLGGSTVDLATVIPVAANDGVAPVIIAGVDGTDGVPGIIISDTEPEEDNVLWADTSEEGADLEVPMTVSVQVYTDEIDERDDATVVFWIPDPYDLPDPFGATAGDCVLRSTPDVVAGVNGITGLWQGTQTEYDAILSLDADVVYFVVADPEP